ncbi:MAG: diphosphatase [Pseudonocardiales bacterium]|nr:diphosphatase [Pseudonocardiales bacterium]
MASFRLPLAHAAFDRVAHRRTDAAWLAEAWERGRVVPISRKSAFPVTADGRVEQRPSAAAGDGPRRLLGVVDDVPVFSVTADPDGDNWQTLREFGARADDLDAGLVVCAVALEQWHQRHTHCPRCGADTVETQAGWTRACVADGSQHFPRTDPAVIMLIHDGADRALLGRGKEWGEGRFSTLAGFVEPGESLEAAVAREVHEEVGVRIRDIRYLASQPWPFPASLMLGFIARLAGNPEINLDPVEMAEAGWFTRDEVRSARDWTDGAVSSDERGANEVTRLRAIPPRLSISRYLIDAWLAGEK